MDDSTHSPEGVFEPVDVDRIADAVVEQIEELIVLGVLRPGARLPAERDLAEALGISRPKLREAIRTLEGRGLVRIRRGEGAFVESLTGSLMTPALAGLCGRHPSAHADFIAFRREVEAYAARLAAERATGADDEALESRIAAMQELLGTGELERESALDLGFHLTVVEAAHNLMLLHVMRAIYDMMSDGVFRNREMVAGDPAARRALFEQHRAIAEAIIDRDPEAAAAASARHMDHVADITRASAEETARGRIAAKRLRVTRTTMDAPDRRRR